MLHLDSAGNVIDCEIVSAQKTSLLNFVRGKWHAMLC